VKVSVVKNVLAANDRIAVDNRELFDKNKVYVINLMSSPGAGKTSLVERTILALRDKYKIGVIEGDIQDTYDADRIAKLDIPVVQINTGGACHIDGNMIREALHTFDLSKTDLLIVKIMLLSTPEGADKPAKYPLMFQESAALLINKIDLMPYVDFDLEKAKRDALSLHKDLKIFEVSCKTATGLDAWIAWLTQRIDAFKKK
jgi:hydrogenase nickel incorporation protein HypB